MVLKKIGVVSVGKLAGVVYGAFGLVVGFFFSIAALLGLVANFADTGEPAIEALFGVAAIFIMPLIYGVTGAVGAMVAALIFNGSAGVIGGIEVTLEDSTRTQATEPA